MKQFFTPLRIAATSVIVIMIIMQITFAINSGGENSPMIQFEFAQSVVDVEGITGSFDNRNSEMIFSLLETNDYDILFFIAYSSFLWLLAREFFRNKNMPLYIASAAMAVAIALFDFLENVQLNRILFNSISGIDFESNIANMHVFTWIKWFLLSIIIAVFSFYFKKEKKAPFLLSKLLYIPLILGLIAFFSDKISLQIIFSYTIFAAIAFFVVRAFVVKPAI